MAGNGLVAAEAAHQIRNEKAHGFENRGLFRRRYDGVQSVTLREVAFYQAVMPVCACTSPTSTSKH
jgi:hypothetical protein